MKDNLTNLELYKHKDIKMADFLIVDNYRLLHSPRLEPDEHPQWPGSYPPPTGCKYNDYSRIKYYSFK